MGEIKNEYKILVRKCQEKILKDFGIDGRKLLKCTFKYGVRTNSN
jgi:hypothetical protein